MGSMTLDEMRATLKRHNIRWRGGFTPASAVADCIAALESRLVEVQVELDEFRRGLPGMLSTERRLANAETLVDVLTRSGDVVAAESLTTARARIASLTEALWGFDYNPNGKPGARGYFCSGCDVDGDDRATSPYHDDDCSAARAALESEAR